MRLTKRQLFRLAGLLLGLLLVVSIVIFYNLDKVSINNELVNLDLLPKPEKLTELYFNNSANLPSLTNGNPVTGTYSGTVHDISSNVKTSLSFTDMQQSQGKITGYLVLDSGINGSGPFSGTMYANRLHLTVKDPIMLARGKSIRPIVNTASGAILILLNTCWWSDLSRCG